MPCYHPLTMYRAASLNPSGRRSLTSNHHGSFTGNPVQVPCGQCVGCRLERSRQWAVRCMHEASLYDDNCFITLTYDDDHLPANGSLVREDMQRFLKRLRKWSVSRRGRSFRFYYCGEYGELFERPHYHALLFDLDFKDKKIWRTTSGGHRLYRSETLEGIWTVGSSEIGDVSFESAAYVARYCVKKVTGDLAADYYGGRLPEFGQPSLKPGIGQPWLDKYGADVYPDDYVLSRGVKAKPPRYYDKWFEKFDFGQFEIVKDARRPHDSVDFRRRKLENSPARRAVKEEVAFSRLDQLKRGLE